MLFYRFNQKRKRFFDRLQADGFSVSGKMIFRDDGASRGCRGNVDEPDRLFGCSATRTGKSRDGDGVIDAKCAQGARGHFERRFCGDGAVCGERLRANAEQLFLDTAVIGYDTAEEYGGCTGDVGNESRNKTSGTAFRCTEGYVFFKAKRNQRFRKR